MLRYFEHIKQCFPYPYIGLRGCTKLSNSGLFVNSLEGITFARLADLQHAELPQVEKLYKSVHDKSVLELSQDFLGVLSKNGFTFNHLLEEYALGYHGKEIKETGYDRVFIEVYKSCNDTFTAMKIDEISFIPDCDADTTIYIYDGVVEHQIIVKLLGGTVNRIPINYISFNESIEIQIKDCENFNLLDYRTTCKCGRTNCTCYECPDCFYAKTGFITDDEKTYKHNGIRIVGQCMCDPSKLLCKYAQFFAWPLLYKIGINLMLEANQSDGITRYLTLGKEKINDNLLRWRGGVNEITGFPVQGDYPRFMTDNTKFILKSVDSIPSKCLNCDGYHIINN